MSDEEVIKRRLLIDGDGTGDDRRLNNLMKNIIKWTNNTDPAENDVMYNRILVQFGQVEMAGRRSKLLTAASQKQIEYFKEQQALGEQKIEEVKKKIEVSKARLEEAKILKRNRMQYDLVAQSIKEQPARSVTEARLKAVETRLKELKDEETGLDNKLESRKQQFSVLVSSANRLRTMLEEDEGEIMNTSLDDITNNSPGPEPMSE